MTIKISIIKAIKFIVIVRNFCVNLQTVVIYKFTFLKPIKNYVPYKKEQLRKRKQCGTFKFFINLEVIIIELPITNFGVSLHDVSMHYKIEACNLPFKYKCVGLFFFR